MISGLIILLAYAKVSQQIGSYFNLLTPWFVGAFTKNIVVELLYTFRIGGDGTDYSFFLITLGNTVEVLSFLITYYYCKGISVSLFRRVTPLYWRESMILILATIFLFLPIYLEFGLDVILDPRSVYLQTRTGYGLSYFLSAFLLRVSFVLVMFSLNNNWSKIVTAGLIFSIIGYCTGSKTVLFSFIVIVFIYWIKSTQFSLGLKSFVLLLVTAFFLLTTAIALLRPSTDTTEISKEMFFDILLTYSDYNRNGQVLIDKEHKPQLGRIFLEDYFVSKIPRVLYPEKPRNFGSIALAEIYFPEWFETDTGAPSFGSGVAYADFGEIFPLWLILCGFIQGYFLKTIERSYNDFSNPYTFVLLLHFCGISLLSAGVGSFLFEMVIFMLLLSNLNNFNLCSFIFGKKTAPPAK
ncbi:hypothetical protein [Geobacter sp. SVR]|uniref:hypothetical protein n=1 Tax=Geobacter sp. SVR TaxID=2495594 RepID=UPI00143EFA56|nr:hypothetical protein [Geobacter sp. SVR]BCS55014.1 O-antigen polymerase [Geobacter sp. SVR]GCF85195.1 O-antigen polymerase [Geobacter sp. SVR]